MAYSACPEKDLNLYELNNRLDKAKTQIFLGSNSGFYGSLLCSLNFIWSRECQTAATDGVNIWWNPDWFMTLSIKTVATIIRHELDHVARLHMLRKGDRDMRIWNYACDYRINNDLENDGYKFDGTHPLIDHSFDKNELMAEEDIYRLLTQKGAPSLGSWEPDGEVDIVPVEVTPEIANKIIGNVVSAVHTAKACGEQTPGNVSKIVEQFLNPIIDWRITLRQFFTDQMNQDFSYRRPNRRFHDEYLPSLMDEDEGRLECLLYFQDVSGSITEQDSLRFNSELKYVWDDLRPKKIIVAQFDTIIQKVDVFENEDRFDWIETVGGGGTSLEPVLEMILKEKPTAAVIFSDLFCAPMDCSSVHCPLIWVTIGNRSAQVEKGVMIHIK
ncbi:HNH endonuclease [Stenotrophomonas phage Pokken]|uniref:Putative metallopeptidase n=1 Tax=Stenotrophomonas phage Pokken TaxID=2596674 RepID=A0A5B9N8Y0_9CAUD|nr:HNH endonuclease [Stenotrophomonas phage Pokken]QEG09255.1 putative metallopeptidase [Stenotrophomonas phage Pokken]